VIFLTEKSRDTRYTTHTGHVPQSALVDPPRPVAAKRRIRLAAFARAEISQITCAVRQPGSMNLELRCPALRREGMPANHCLLSMCPAPSWTWTLVRNSNAGGKSISFSRHCSARHSFARSRGAIWTHYIQPWPLAGLWQRTRGVGRWRCTGGHSEIAVDCTKYNRAPINVA
jgi:hypothetical protein